MQIEVRGSLANVKIEGSGRDMLEADQRAVFEALVDERLDRVEGFHGA